MAGLSREACDRCHKLKTRCERSSGFHACTRCTRLGKSCCYSPPGRTGRPVGSKRANKIAGAGGESRLDKTFVLKQLASSSSISSSSAGASNVSANSCKQVHQNLPQPEELSAQSAVSTTLTNASSIASSNPNYTASTASTAGPVPRDYYNFEFFNTPITGSDDEPMNPYFIYGFADTHNSLCAAAIPATVSTVATSPSDTFPTMGQSEHQSPHPDPNPKATAAEFLPYATANDDTLSHQLVDIWTRLFNLNPYEYPSGLANDPRDVETVSAILDGYDEQQYRQHHQNYHQRPR